MRISSLFILFALLAVTFVCVQAEDPLFEETSELSSEETTFTSESSSEESSSAESTSESTEQSSETSESSEESSSEESSSAESSSAESTSESTEQSSETSESSSAESTSESSEQSSSETSESSETTEASSEESTVETSEDSSSAVTTAPPKFSSSSIVRSTTSSTVTETSGLSTSEQTTEQTTEQVAFSSFGPTGTETKGSLEFGGEVTEEQVQDSISKALDTDKERIRIDSITPSSKRDTTTKVDFTILEEEGSPSSVVLMKTLQDKIAQNPEVLGVPATLKVVSVNYNAEYSTFGLTTASKANVASGSTSIGFAVATIASLFVLAL